MDFQGKGGALIAARFGSDKVILVKRGSGADPLSFSVVVSDGGGETRHAVTVARADWARLASGRSGEALVAAAFRFLLEREGKESILPRFDLSVIARYFPEFERALPGYFEEPQ